MAGTTTKLKRGVELSKEEIYHIASDLTFICKHPFSWLDAYYTCLVVEPLYPLIHITEPYVTVILLLDVTMYFVITAYSVLL
jgi:hypothetical protein